jgi:hypothetical protein
MAGDAADHGMPWDTVRDDLPMLLATVEAMLSELGE